MYVFIAAIWLSFGSTFTASKTLPSQESCELEAAIIIADLNREFPGDIHKLRYRCVPKGTDERHEALDIIVKEEANPTPEKFPVEPAQRA